MRHSLTGILAITLSITSFCTPVKAQEINTSETQGVSLTIYNQNFGVVKDVRNIGLHPGLNVVRFSDVAAQIDPTSVSLQSISSPNSLTVREQNYQYDLIDPTTILSKSIGKTLKFRQILQNGSVHEFSGTLLNSPTAVIGDSNGGTSTRYQGLVIKTAEGILLNPVGEIELAELPPGLISKPSLVWHLETNKGGTNTAEVAYQTQGLNWKCDYVAVLNAEDTQLSLNSWVTLDNKSGASYPQAALKLLAGDVHRVTPQQQNYGAPMAMAKSMNAGGAFQEQAFAEYHLYALQGKTDVKDNETKQMSLFNADKIPAKKQFVFDPVSGGYGYYRGNAGSGKVQVKIEVENSEKNGLGMPMPKGKVRVYKKDQDGALQFIGEDSIDHTPHGEKIRLYIGDAFDIVGERKQMRSENVSTHLRRDTYEVSVRNHKKSAVTVLVLEHPYGDWSVADSSNAYNRKDANNLEFPVSVPADSETKISYTIETRF